MLQYSYVHTYSLKHVFELTLCFSNQYLIALLE